jgi:hypothetical protein
MGQREANLSEDSPRRLELDLYLRVSPSLHEWSAVEYVEKL